MIARILRPSAWPVVVKVPILVAILMIGISAVLTNQVLNRLAETQERHFQELTATYLDGLSSSIIPAVLREDSWETFDNLDRARSLYRGLTVLETVVVGTAGTVLASSNPKEVPSYGPPPAAMIERFGQTSDAWFNEKNGRAGARRVLVYQRQTIGTIYAEFDVRALFKERQNVLWTLIGTNFLITVLVATAGFLAVRRLLQPVHILTNHLRGGASGRVPPLPEHQIGREHSEFGRLFRHYNAMVTAWNEREALTLRIAEETRLTSLGRLAAAMAHEINNPLGGLFNAIETLKRHGHSASPRERAIMLLDRGLAGIRDVVRSALIAYRADSADRPLKAADIDDLRLLIEPEVERRNLDLVWRNQLAGDVPVNAGAIRQVVLNVLLNACQASPVAGIIRVVVSHESGLLVVSITDEGPGLDPDNARYLEGRELMTAPPPGGPGLGLWIIRRLVAEAHGSLHVDCPAGSGTTITIMVPDAKMEEIRHVA